MAYGVQLPLRFGAKLDRIEVEAKHIQTRHASSEFDLKFASAGELGSNTVNPNMHILASVEIGHLNSRHHKHQKNVDRSLQTS